MIIYVATPLKAYSANSNRISNFGNLVYTTFLRLYLAGNSQYFEVRLFPRDCFWSNSSFFRELSTAVGSSYRAGVRSFTRGANFTLGPKDPANPWRDWKARRFWANSSTLGKSCPLRKIRTQVPYICTTDCKRALATRMKDSYSV